MNRSRRGRRGRQLLATAAVWSVVLAACGGADDEPVAGSESATSAETLDQADRAEQVDEAEQQQAPATGSSSAPTGDVLPASTFDADAVTVDGDAYDLSQLAGTDVVLWFWAPW